MITRYPVRLRVWMIALVVSGVLSNGAALWKVTASAGRSGHAEVTRTDSRFARVKAAIPPHETVGYLDESAHGVGTSDLARAKGLFLAQYALAPIIVKEGSEPSLVIADFPAGGRASIAGTGLTLVDEFGDGIFLLRRLER